MTLPLDVQISFLSTVPVHTCKRPGQTQANDSLPVLFARSVSSLRPLSCTSSSPRAYFGPISATSTTLGTAPGPSSKQQEGHFLLHSSVSSFVLSVCVSVHQEHFQSQPPSPPPPRHRHRSLLSRRHIIPHHRSFCHYSRAPTIQSYPLFASTPPRTHALIRPRAPQPTNQPTNHQHNPARFDIEPGLLVLVCTKDSALIFIKCPHVFHLAAPHQLRRARTVKSLLPARATRLQRHT